MKSETAVVTLLTYVTEFELRLGYADDNSTLKMCAVVLIEMVHQGY